MSGLHDPACGHSQPVSDEVQERDEEHVEEEHPLESPEALRRPRDDDEEQDRAPQPGVTPDLDER
jgi:hypothetical protein